MNDEDQILTGRTSDQPLSQNRPQPLAQQQLDALVANLLTATARTDQLRISLDRLSKQLNFLQRHNEDLQQQLYHEQQRNTALLDLIDPDPDKEPQDKS